MAVDAFDFGISVDGTEYKFRAHRGGETPFQKSTVRAELSEQEMFSEVNRGRMVSRPDLRSFWQSDWSGGWEWFRPTLRNADGNSYEESDYFDSFTRPGTLIPYNKINDISSGNVPLSTSRIVTMEDSGAAKLAIVTSTLDGNSDYRVATWNSGTKAWDFLGTISAGSAVGIHSMTFDPSDDKVYVVADSAGFSGGSGSGLISRFDGAAHDDDWLAVTLNGPGELAAVDDGLLFYDGDAWYTIDKATPAVGAAVADDGLGPDVLRFSSLSAYYNMRHYKMAAATPRGLFYAKNVIRNEQVTPFVFRLDLTDTGSWLVRPVANLPAGMMVTHVVGHLDSLVMLATRDPLTVMDGDGTEPPARFELWHVTGGQVGQLGVFDGESHRQTDATADRQPRAILGSDGPHLWIGSGDGNSEFNAYVYDGAGGGIHMLSDNGGAGNGPISMAVDEIGTKVFTGYQQASWYIEGASVIDLPSSMNVVSNWIDFGNVLEEKRIVGVDLFTEGGSGTGTITVAVRNEESGTFETVLTLTDMTKDGVTSADISTWAASDIKGTRFEYRITFTPTSITTAPRILGLRLRAMSGVMVDQYVLTVDATEIVNVENEQVAPEDVYDDLATAAAEQDVVLFSDYFSKRESTAESAVHCKINAVQLSYGQQGEAIAQISLTKVY